MQPVIRAIVRVGNGYDKTRLYSPIRSKTLRFRGVLATAVRSEDTQVLCTEVMNLLEKRAKEIVPPAQSESGFYSCYFLVPKKDGGLRPILDLRLLNYALMKRSFRMITLKPILSQICPEDWFMSLDLKDTYFLIQVDPHHRRFLRFAFEGVAYQYKVLKFGLSLAPRTFTRCMDAALSPLRLMGICILNYLDDWLILAQLKVVLTSHKNFLLRHLRCLGLRVNFAKSILSHCQRVLFLGTIIVSYADNSNNISGVSHDNSAPRGLLQGRYGPSAQRLPENAGPHGSGFAGTSVESASNVTHPVLAEAEGSIRGLASRMAPRNGDSGLCISPGQLARPLLATARRDLRHDLRRKVVMTDASNKGWGALCEDKPTFGIWSEKESGLHIICIEMLTVC